MLLQTGISKLLEVVLVPHIKPAVDVFSTLSHDITEVMCLSSYIDTSPVVQCMIMRGV